MRSPQIPSFAELGQTLGVLGAIESTAFHVGLHGLSRSLVQQAACLSRGR